MFSPFVKSWYVQLFYAEPVHCTSEKTSLIKRAADMERITFNRERAVVCLSVTRIIDSSARILLAVFLETMKHIQTYELTFLESRIRIIGIYRRSAVCFCRILKPDYFSVVNIALLIDLYNS